MYGNHLTVVVINNVHGRCFPNNRWSIRQGDRPSSILFCYGLDPHLDWLENRLRGIPIYENLLSTSGISRETYKLIAYVDDVKPSITSLNEFSVVDRGSALFEAASGCILHRDPASGKVKFLPLGRWKGTLSREDLPVNYIVLSDHLDMVGVKLLATYQKTRKVNCDELLDKVKNTTGSWKTGKFMPLTSRPHSVNTFCLSKVLFRCSSINLRVCDLTKIGSSVKSWLYSDQLEKPQELVLFKPRQVGGLGLISIQYKALSLLIRNFLETAVNPKFQSNLYHEALYLWHVENRRDISQPPVSPYYDSDFFDSIKQVKEEGLLNIRTMTMWYRVLTEENITHQQITSGAALIPCRIEAKNPQVDWERTWSLVTTSGLSSKQLTFIWKMVHDLLPTQVRLFRLKMPNTISEICTLCNLNQAGNLTHSLLLCPYNNGVGLFLVEKLSQYIPNLLPEQVVLLDLAVDKEHQLPFTFLIASILSDVWDSRKEKKPCHLTSIRAALEAGINILRKSRHHKAAATLDTILI